MNELNIRFGRKLTSHQIKSKSPFQYDAWIWPVNVGGEHWTSVALYPSHQVVLYYDSFGGGGAKCRECCLLMLEWAEMVWNSEGRNSPFPGNDWQIVQITNGPRQPNQYDCGVYCCQALYELAQGLPSRRLAEGWRFGGTDLPNLRMVMTEEIATRRLRVRF
nr:uncharacterized protein I203_07450 [Kwoniella mangroviensis CBS 8507]OCF63384.1 hypothetical protein I203_07450 [Kwoniella mangroviensis CBS 8507]